ncbi:proteasome assembly chaperone family protein [Amycolatopsis anabasis]|uniref:proteasome assembly chaperone family protein n=1 Tax=Amycolatopsis anabasis TaxID=1840409 RepID=UPI001FE5677B|nr:PAC2 family protein [Amycolatopsis anabasis]
MLDPEELYEVDSDVPDLDGAVLLHQLEGFMDAGSAGRLVTEHLLETFEHRVVARFDVDRLIDYRSRRPMMTFRSDHWAEYEEPELVVRLLHDANGTPFLLLTGLEPDREWKLFTDAVLSLAERWKIRLAVGFHGIPMGAPHTRPLGVTAHGTRTELVGGYTPMGNTLEVPGSADALLELRLGKLGVDAVGFAAHVPHYLSQASYPAAALTLLSSVTRSAGLEVPDSTLREAGRRADAEIERQVEESTEVAEVVQALERQYDAFTEATRRRSLLADSVENMPTAEELGAEFERFLAEQGRGDAQDH